MPRARTTLHVNDRRVRDILLWARRERIVLHRIELGDVVLDLNDTHLAAKLPERAAGSSADLEPDRGNLYRKHGGALLRDFEAAQSAPGTSDAETNMQDADE